MEYIAVFFQIVVPLGIFNVWFLRPQRPTAYRGGGSQSLKEEFAAYGLPGWAFCAVGFAKVSAAILILLGFLLPVLTTTGAAVMSVLMGGAIAMHLKVGDPPSKSMPAAAMLFMSLWLLIA